MEDKVFTFQFEEEKNNQIFNELNMNHYDDIGLTISNNLNEFDDIENLLLINKEKEVETEIETKKAKIKQINKESAKRYRQKKKALFEKLTLENKKLKKENLKLKKLLKEQICPICLEQTKNKKKIFISQTGRKSSNNIKKGSSIILSMTILFLFFYNFSKFNHSENYLKEISIGKRNLNEKENFDVSLKEIQEAKIGFQGMDIYMGNYYSVSNYYDLLGKEIYKFNNKGKLKLNEENDIFNTYIKKNQSCSKCLTDISNNIKINDTNPFYFNIYISNQTLSGESKNDILNLKLNKPTSIFDLTCKVIGISQHFIE